MGWQEIELVLKKDDDLIEAQHIFDDLFADGYMLDDPRQTLEHIQQGYWDAHEFEDKLLENSPIRLVGYLETNARTQLDDLRNRLSDKMIQAELRIKQLAEVDWQEDWKKNFDVIAIGNRIQIVPTWLTAKEPKDVVVYLEQGIGFGTGTHETTQLILSLLEKYLEEDKKVIDVGCGSGILAIAAHRLGAKEVEAMDIDVQAIQATRRNLKLNDLEFSVYQSDLLKSCDRKANLIIANLVTDAILLLVPQLKRCLYEEGLFLASGIHKERVKEVVTHLELMGFHLMEIQTGNDWVALAAVLKEKSI